MSTQLPRVPHASAHRLTLRTDDCNMANQPHTRLIKVPEVCNRRARGRASHYEDIARGLFTRPVKMGTRTSSWPEYEVEALIRARIAGKTDDEIRALVAKLEADRAKA